MIWQTYTKFQIWPCYYYVTPSLISWWSSRLSSVPDLALRLLHHPFTYHLFHSHLGASVRGTVYQISGSKAMLTSTWSSSTSLSWLLIPWVNVRLNFKFLYSSWLSKIVITIRSTSMWSSSCRRYGKAITAELSGRIDVGPEGTDQLLPLSQLKRCTLLFP